jgi:hypothetical protein
VADRGGGRRVARVGSVAAGELDRICIHHLTRRGVMCPSTPARRRRARLPSPSHHWGHRDHRRDCCAPPSRRSRRDGRAGHRLGRRRLHDADCGHCRSRLGSGPSTRVPVGTAFQSNVQVLTGPFNIAGALCLVVGAIYSAYVYMPKRKCCARRCRPPCSPSSMEALRWQ